MRAHASQQATETASERRAAGQRHGADLDPVQQISRTGVAVVQRKSACACGGGCPRCQAKSDRSTYAINAPGDRYEQEADRVAKQVMRMPDPAVPPSIGHASAPGSIQRACASCGGGSGEREEEIEMQAKEEQGERPRVDENVQGRIDSLRGGGSPLPGSVRELFEPRFGHDFGSVRVHTDSRAAETARAVRAQAYTIGGDIVFGAGRYAPETESGQRLLAHELVHTIQQGASAPTGGSVRSGADGGAGGVQRTPAISVQRLPNKRIQRVDDATFETGSGVGPAITAGTMTTDPAIHRQTVTATNCFGREGCNIRFRFAKAYKGDYNLVAQGGRTVRGVYIKLSVRYDADACGPCHQVRLLQVVRSITESGGSMVTADPGDAARRERSGWNDPNARSRGWRVDALHGDPNPYVTSMWTGQPGSATTPALFYDAPGNWAGDTNKGLEFNTCAICSPRSGASTSLACVRWGYYINSTGDVSFRPAVPVAICGVTQPLNDATLRWGRIAGNTPANVDFRREPPPPSPPAEEPAEE